MSARSGVLLLLLLSACDASHSENSEARQEPKALPAVVKTAALVSAQRARPIEGTATIVNPDGLLQLDADLRAAEIAVAFSASQFDRAQRLIKSSVAMSRQGYENAERAADADATQLRLLELRLRQTWGDEAPFLAKQNRERIVAELAGARQALVRLDLPRSDGGGVRNMRVRSLGGGPEGPVSVVWQAPVGNQAMPGASYFGLIAAGPGLRSGDRAVLLADRGDDSEGVVIPHAAIVVLDSQAWCYVDADDGRYERKPVSLSHPVEEGFLVATGFTPGTKVVVRGASSLLAREADPDWLEDDDDGDDRAPSAGASAAPATLSVSEVSTVKDPD